MAAGVTRVGGFHYLRARAIRVTMAGGLTFSHVNTPGRLGLIRLPELAFYLRRTQQQTGSSLQDQMLRQASYIGETGRD